MVVLPQALGEEATIALRFPRDQAGRLQPSEVAADWYQLRILLEVMRTEEHLASTTVNQTVVSHIHHLLVDVNYRNLVMAIPNAMLSLVLAIACIFLLLGLTKEQPRLLLPCLAIWPLASAFRIALIWLMHNRSE